MESMETRHQAHLAEARIQLCIIDAKPAEEQLILEICLGVLHCRKSVSTSARHIRRPIDCPDMAYMGGERWFSESQKGIGKSDASTPDELFWQWVLAAA